jgi:CheY-like chemotaxis protein
MRNHLPDLARDPVDLDRLSSVDKPQFYMSPIGQTAYTFRIGPHGHSSATSEERMMPVKILLVDDNIVVRFTLCKVLEQQGFNVTCASDVTEALKYISTEKYDVLLSDLHMPGAGDGLTVVSAMRHSNPEAVTLLLSAFPEMTAAANAILMQTDEILVKPMQITDLVEAIAQRLAKGPLHKRKVESLATILERTATSSIDDWYAAVEMEEVLMAIPLSREDRCRHLPQVFRDLALRLHAFKPLGTKELESEAALQHGTERRQQGYTAAMMVEESRILQVTIFHTLQNNLGTIDFSVLLLGVMTIADEVDSQLSQAMKSYTRESVRDALPA